MREADGPKEEIGFPSQPLVGRIVHRWLNARDKRDGGPFGFLSADDGYSAPDPEPRRCPDCGDEMDWADCVAFDCEEGLVDAYEDDPINEEPGTLVPCSQCDGQGGWWVCTPCYNKALAAKQAAGGGR
jgi:hypothetical protein